MPPFIGPCYRHFYQGQGVTLMPQRPQIKLIISPGMQSWCIHHIYPGAANTNCVPTGDNMQHHISSNGGGDNYIASCNGGILAQSPVTQLPSGQPIVGDLLQWYITFHSIRLDNQTLHSEVHQLQLSKHIQDLQGSQESEPDDASISAVGKNNVANRSSLYNHILYKSESCKHVPIKRGTLFCTLGVFLPSNSSMLLNKKCQL